MKRLLFLLIWVSFISWVFLRLFAPDVLRSLLGLLVSSLPLDYLRLLPLLILAAIVILLAARFVWTVSLMLDLLFYPIAMLVRVPLWIFRAVRSAVRMPSRIRAILRSPQFNAILLLLVTFSVVAILQEWYPSLLPALLSIVVLAVISMLAHAVTLASRPGLFHRSVANLFLDTLG